MKFRLNLVGIGKLLFFIFVVYISWYREAFGIHQVLLYGPVIALTGIVVFDMFLIKSVKLDNFPDILKMYFVLSIYSVLTGLIVAPNKAACVSSVITFFAYSMVCFEVYYLSLRTGSIKWVFQILVFCGILCSLSMIFNGYVYETSGVHVITLGPDNNPNYLAMVLLVSLFSLLYDYKNIIKYFIPTILIFLLFCVTIIMTASRKNFICLALLLFGWIILFIKQLKNSAPGEKRGKIKIRSFFYLVIIIIGIIVSTSYILKNFASTNIYTKFVKSLSEGEGVGSRLLLYKEAWTMFKEHPIFGVGFDQYRIYSSIGKYSHSTYAEVLSCLGITGAFLFFVPIFKTYFQMLSAFFNHKMKDYLMIFSMLMFTVELIIAVGQIFLYEFYHLLLLTLIFWIWKRYLTQPSTDVTDQIIC